MKPRVLELEELYGHDGAFLVEYNPQRLSRKADWAFFIYMNAKRVHLRFLMGPESYSREQYGVTWRCWTERPTDRQMEEAEWHAAGGEG